jgi:LuxR family maltose regulon positive regulatory protein
VTVVSAPAGSGKTVLLQSWIARADRAARVAWVPVTAGERDPQRFWVAVADALRSTTAGSALVRPLTAAPDLDGWAIVEQLLEDLAGLVDRVWLVVDDVHELASAEALRQLELLVLRGPDRLRLILASRHDLLLGLHRLRLQGELNEIRTADLRLSLTEAHALFAEAGVALSGNALALLYARTEGWAAGLRLAALSMSGHPDPERFAADFSGSERTVAGYLLAEVLERQSEPVRRLLLRTSVLERVCGDLADQLTGVLGAERVLQDLERAGAFVASIDTRQSWFRYHQLFAELLQLELRRSAPAEIPLLHRTAAQWFAGHGFPVEAVRHAQAGQDWKLAAHLLSDRWIDLYLNGQAATARELLAAFPSAVVMSDAELTTLMAADELSRGSPEEAERYLSYAAPGLAADQELRDSDGPMPADRCRRLKVLLSIARLWLAQQRVDLRAVAEEVGQLLVSVETDAGLRDLGADLRALAMVNLGIAEIWSARMDDAERHLGQGVALAHRAGRPYLELTGLAHGARVAVFRSLVLAEQRSRQAIELARQHGWGEDQATAFACTMLGAALTGQGRLAEAEPWLDRARRTLRTDVQPADGVSLHYAGGLLEMARGRHAGALADLRAGERLSNTLVTPHALVRSMRALMLLAHVGLGETGRAEAILAGLDEHERRSAQMRIALASWRLARQEPQAALAALEPMLDSSSDQAEVQASWVVEALVLEASARDALGDPGAAGQALERALDVAEPHRELVSFLLHPVPALLRRQAGQRTAHAGLIAEILDLLAGTTPASPPPGMQRPLEALSGSELRVLRYLPTHLSAPEIAAELFVSTSTVKTHLRNLYVKLGVHRRADAVKVARTLHLLAPSVQQR